MVKIDEKKKHSHILRVNISLDFDKTRNAFAPLVYKRRRSLALSNFSIHAHTVLIIKVTIYVCFEWCDAYVEKCWVFFGSFFIICILMQKWKATIQLASMTMAKSIFTCGQDEKTRFTFWISIGEIPSLCNTHTHTHAQMLLFGPLLLVKHIMSRDRQ